MELSERSESRFTGRVDSYKLARPGYPKEIVALLQRECGLTPQSRIVDVAAGTGIFAELFLENGNIVTAIEPNVEMRSACIELQRRYSRLLAIEGTAEHTGLPETCADFITVAQALHWFHLERTRKEFARILKRNGWCVIAYNERRPDSDLFHRSYEDLLRRFGIDYEAVQSKYPNEGALRAFFDPASMRRVRLDNFQLLDRDALIGRVVSSSYMPTPGHPGYDEMLKEIERLFTENQRNGVVRLNYDCTLSYGQLAGKDCRKR